MSICIGLDLDNTIIRYDHAFIVAALERELLPKDFSGTKQQVRDHIRAHAGQDGEAVWQELQGYVYGKGIMHAELFAGVIPFLGQAKKRNTTLYIVSHKTQFGHFDADKVDLRIAAKAFLKAKGIFKYLPEEHLFFCTTRTEKVQKIAALGCDSFVDDLEEVFTDPDFPPQVRKLLFTTSDAGHGFEICRNWKQIEKSLFS